MKSCEYACQSMKSLTPCAALVFFNHAVSAVVSGASDSLRPLKSSPHGLSDAPPVVSHLKAQLRLISWPMQVLPEVDWRFLRQRRSVVWV